MLKPNWKIGEGSLNHQALHFPLGQQEGVNDAV